MRAETNSALSRHCDRCGNYTDDRLQFDGQGYVCPTCLRGAPAFKEAR